MLPMVTNDAKVHPTDENDFLVRLRVPAPETQTAMKMFDPINRLCYATNPNDAIQWDVSLNAPNHHCNWNKKKIYKIRILENLAKKKYPSYMYLQSFFFLHVKSIKENYRKEGIFFNIKDIHMYNPDFALSKFFSSVFLTDRYRHFFFTQYAKNIKMKSQHLRKRRKGIFVE